MKKLKKIVSILLISTFIASPGLYAETCPTTIEETINAVDKSESATRTPASRTLPPDRVHGTRVSASELPPALRFLAGFKAEVLSNKPVTKKKAEKTLDKGSRYFQLSFPGFDKISKTAEKAAKRKAPANRPLLTVNEYEQLEFEFDVQLELMNKSGIFAKLITLGHHRRMFKMINGMMNKLYVEGDAVEWEVSISANPIPNAFIDVLDKKVEVTLGLFSFCRNEDEFASVLAHEMTHGNFEHLAASVDKPEIVEILDSIRSTSELDTDQREEIRADLGAIDRLVNAGYNPFSQYDLQKRFYDVFENNLDYGVMTFIYRRIFKKSFAYQSTHPASEVRMAASKTFITYLSRKRDLADNLGSKNYKPFRGSIKLMQMRSRLYTFVITSKWFRRGVSGYWIYLLAKSLGLLDTALYKNTIGAAWNSVSSHAPSGDSVFKFIGTVGPYVLGLLGVVGVLGSFWLIRSLLEDYRYSRSRKRDMTARSSAALEQRKIITELQRLILKLNTLDFSKKDDKSVLRKLRQLLRISNEYLGIIHRFFSQFRSDTQTRLYKALLGPSVLWETAYELHTGILSSLIDHLEKVPREKRGFELAKTNLLIRKIPGFMVENKKIRKLLQRYEKIRKGEKTYIDEIIKKASHPNSQLQTGEFAVALEFFPKKAPPQDILTFMHKLHKAGLHDTTMTFYDRHITRVIRYVFSSQNARSDNVEKLRNIILALRDKNSRYSLLVRDKTKWNRKFLYLRLATLFKSKKHKFAFRTMSINLPHNNRILDYDFMSINFWLKKRDKRAIKKYLTRTFSSIRDIRDFLEYAQNKQGALLDQISEIIFDVVIAHPEWIKSPADIEALIAGDFFWPKLGTKTASYKDKIEHTLLRLIRKKAEEFPEVWKYDISASEQYHLLIEKKLKEFGLEPKTTNDKYTLWKSLIQRGVSSTTDKLFGDIYDKAGTSLKAELVTAIEQGKLWDPILKERIVTESIKNSSDYKKLIASSEAVQRLPLLKKLIEKIKKAFPEKGNAYLATLEDVSVSIKSTPLESSIIHKAKTVQSGEKSEDLATRIFSDILTQALKWKKRDQWKLLLFLRGDITATPKIKRAFKISGPERVQRMYSTLPIIVKAGIIDSFIDAPKGITPKVSLRRGYARKIVNHVTRSSSPEHKKIVNEVLEGFFVGIEKAAHPSVKNYVLSYLLAMPDGDGNAGETLKNVLEIFGTTGVKIGQFLVASEILPEDMRVILRQLQEKANIPDRETIYRDLREIFKGKDVPARILELLGAASLKYAILGMDQVSREYFVLKVLRLDAIAHTRLEFNMLEAMAEHLNKKYGGSYGIFRSIVRASREAVERELKLKGEVYWGEQARLITYANASDLKYKVSVPMEFLMSDRVIAAEYAKGVSIFDIVKKHRKEIARKIILMEKKIYMDDPTTPGDVIFFDPDRHPGNYRIFINKSSQGPPERGVTFVISPIDFGQMLTLTTKEREMIYNIFALSHIMKEIGSTKWIAEEILKQLNITTIKPGKLKRALKKYFPMREASPITPYYSVLSALEDVGYRAPIAYFDFVRGISQMNQWETFLDKDHTVETPRVRLEGLVREKAMKYVETMDTTKREKIRIYFSQKWYSKKKKKKKKQEPAPSQ